MIGDGIGKLGARLAGLLPRYPGLVWAILAAPVEEVAARVRQGGLAPDATAFWAISATLASIVSYIAYARSADEAVYFAAFLLNEGAVLACLSLAAFWSARIVGGRLRIGQSLTATAYVWGAVLPVHALLVLVLFAIVETASLPLQAIMVDARSGCGEIASVLDIWAQVEAAYDAAPRRAMLAAGAYVALSLPLFAVYAVYGVAFLRAMRRAAGLSLARFCAFVVLFAVLGVGAVALGEAFGLVLLGGAGACG